MPYENKEGYGRLFPNDRKAKENSPDFTGQVKVDGVEKRIAAWEVLDDETGDFKFFNVQIQDQDRQSTSSRPASTGRRSYTKPTR